MKCRLYFFILILYLFPIAVSAQYFRSLGLSDGLTQPSVMAIYQDILGRMWFGTREGINMYDGDHISSFRGWYKTYARKDSLWLGNNAECINGDANGNIYILLDKEIIKYDIRKGSFSKFDEKPAVYYLTAYEGDIYYVKYDTLYSISGETGKKEVITPFNNKGNIRSLSTSSGKFYIGFNNDLEIIDKKTLEIEHIAIDGRVNEAFLDSRGLLWIATYDNGIFQMGEDKVLHHVPYSMDGTGISSTQIRKFIEDEDHNIWIGTFDGLFKYNWKDKTYEFVQISRSLGGLTHSSVFGMWRDRQNTIWIGSYYGGVNYFSPNKTNFLHFNFPNENIPGLNYSYIGDIVADKHEHTWLAVDGGGIICIDKKWNVVKRLVAGPNSLPHNNVKSIAYDKEHDQLFIGTHLGGLCKYDISTGRFTYYLNDYKAGKEAPSDIIMKIIVWGGNAYVFATNGGFMINTSNNKVTKLFNSINHDYRFCINRDGHLYISYNNRFKVCDLATGKELKTVQFSPCGEVAVNSILATDKGVYIATLGCGLFYYDNATREISNYTAEKNQILSNYCYKLALTSDLQKLLITSNKGISNFGLTSHLVYNISLSKNFPNSNTISESGIMTTPDSLIYIGDTRGLTMFHENEFYRVDEQEDKINFFFTNLLVDNNYVIPNDETHILTNSLAFTDKIELSHKINNFTLQFAQSDYGQHLSEHWYEYRLENFDEDWTSTNHSEVHYTNLSPGKYKFEVRALNDRLEPLQTISLKVIIKEPWYSTWWAWIIYLVAVSAIAIYIIINRTRERRLTLSLEREHYEKEQNEKLNQEKLVFFTNVSHEFRTPLTLIISHVDLLLQKSSLSTTIYNQILKVKQNAMKMNYLISELLKFRKLDQNHETLQISQHDLSAFMKEIYLNFRDLGEQRKLNYSFVFRNEDAPCLCWFDSKLLEIAFYNLISNSFKYTKEGSISIQGRYDDDNAIIEVEDTGIGMKEEDVEHIFDRFYKVEQKDKDALNGFGIGLALTKSIIEKHHGTIDVQSSWGAGSKFIVTLPRKKDVFMYDKDVHITDNEESEPAIIEKILPLMDDRMQKKEEEKELHSKNYRILLVEDNDELLQILFDIFSPYYNVETATNGQEGIYKVKNSDVDLIISDVMMPVMSGMEMCLQLKSNIDYCHIPIILLTALNSVDKNIEGLNRGADAYVTKPFNAKLLMARVNNLIRNRLLIQQQLKKKSVDEIDLTSINPLDQQFLKNVSDCIQKHLDDPEFSIPVMCSEIGVGRSVLFAKFKSLTGMTPNSYILNYRLKEAALMFKKYPDMPVSEVSDRCGFNSALYFGQCFKKQYNCTPQQYKKGEN